jgi:hypothetical protein
METVTEILIDFSGSMKEKLSFTKKVLLEDLVPNLDYSSRIGIKTFTSFNKVPQINQVLNLNITNKEEIIQTINSLGTPEGGTPISAAIKASVSTLKEYAANDKKIILVTDGEESGGNYVAEAKKASREGINCQIHIIGIGLNDKAKSQAEEISKITSGTVSFIPFTKTKLTNSSIVRDSLSPFFKSIKSTPMIFPISNKTAVVEKVMQTEVIPQPIIVTEPEMEKILENKVPNSENSDAFNVIMQEITNIQAQLIELKKIKNVIPEIDEDTEHNEKIRKASEEYLFEILKKKYPDRVKWLNENGECYANHDFEILDLDNGSIEYYIECKGTVSNKLTFYLTKNEWRLFLNHTKNYQIYFVKNSLGKPSHIFIDNLLDWLLKGKLVPYLKEMDIIKEERVFLTLNEVAFGD